MLFITLYVKDLELVLELGFGGSSYAGICFDFSELVFYFVNHSFPRNRPFKLLLLIVYACQNQRITHELNRMWLQKRSKAD